MGQRAVAAGEVADDDVVVDIQGVCAAEGMIARGVVADNEVVDVDAASGVALHAECATVDANSAVTGTIKNVARDDVEGTAVDVNFADATGIIGELDVVVIEVRDAAILVEDTGAAIFAEARIGCACEVKRAIGEVVSSVARRFQPSRASCRKLAWLRRFG